MSAISMQASAASAALAGGIVMATSWKIGAGVTAAIVLGWLLWPSHDAGVGPGLETKLPNDTTSEPLVTDVGDARNDRVALSAEATPTAIPSASSSGPSS